MAAASAATIASRAAPVATRSGSCPAGSCSTAGCDRGSRRSARCSGRRLAALRRSATKPTFMSVQLVCCGCGSEFMSWPTPSLLTNVTRAPRATTMSRGDTPAAVMVMVVGAAGRGRGRRGRRRAWARATATGRPGCRLRTRRRRARPEMVRVRAARLAAQMRTRHEGPPEKRDGGRSTRCPGGGCGDCRASGAALHTRRGPRGNSLAGRQRRADLLRRRRFAAKTSTRGPAGAAAQPAGTASPGPACGCTPP